MKKKDIFILRDLESFSSITESIRNQKLQFRNQVIRQGIIEANYNISRQLQIPLASKVFFIKKLRIVENEPRSIETNYIDVKRIQGLETIDFNDKSFYDILAKEKGIRTMRSEEEILVMEAKDDECALLQMPPASEILFIKGLTYIAENDVPFEYFELACDPSFYQFRSVMSV